MPDLDILVALTCFSNESWTKSVVGSKGTTYNVKWSRLSPVEANRRHCQYGWECTCDGWKYRRTCRHVTAAEKERCGWNAEIDPGASTTSETGEHTCPRCNGPLVGVRVGV